MTTALSSNPVLARPRLLAWVNSRPMAAMIAPTAANGIKNQLPQPSSGMNASTIHTSATMPHTRLINPMVFSLT
ncbi:hypothetical protein D3C72_2329890 [compost metagenome]